MPLPNSFPQDEVVRISSRRSLVFSRLILNKAIPEDIKEVRYAYLRIDSILGQISQNSQKNHVVILLEQMHGPKDQIISILKKYNAYPLPY